MSWINFSQFFRVNETPINQWSSPRGIQKFLIFLWVRHPCKEQSSNRRFNSICANKYITSSIDLVFKVVSKNQKRSWGERTYNQPVYGRDGECKSCWSVYQNQSNGDVVRDFSGGLPYGYEGPRLGAWKGQTDSWIWHISEIPFLMISKILNPFFWSAFLISKTTP